MTQIQITLNNKQNKKVEKYQKDHKYKISKADAILEILDEHN